MKRMLLEIAILTVAALILGLGWNLFNDNGITLSRDLTSPTQKKVDDPPSNTGGNGGNDGAVVTSPPEENGDSDPNGESNGNATEAPAEEPREWTEDGITYMNLAAAYEHFREKSAVFVDARPDKEFVKGHIQGAVHLYHGNADRYIDDMTDQLLERGFIIVYCIGGDCEDSTALASFMTTALGLEDAGLVYVFKGGLEKWTEKGLPVEQGE